MGLLVLAHTGSLTAQRATSHHESSRIATTFAVQPHYQVFERSSSPLQPWGAARQAPLANTAAPQAPCRLSTAGVLQLPRSRTPTVAVVFDRSGEVAACVADVGLLEEALTPRALAAHAQSIAAAPVLMLDGNMSEAAIEVRRGREFVGRGWSATAAQCRLAAAPFAAEEGQCGASSGACSRQRSWCSPVVCTAAHRHFSQSQFNPTCPAPLPHPCRPPAGWRPPRACPSGLSPCRRPRRCARRAC